MIGCSSENKAEKEKLTLPEQKTELAQLINACQRCASSDFTDQQADTSFIFSNGKKVLLCGDVEKQDGKTVYSEFVLYECGRDSIWNFWPVNDGYDYYGIDFSSDTLKLNKQKLLAVGKNRDIILATWLTESVFYSNSNLKRHIKFSSSLKYTQAQIDQTVAEYEKFIPQFNKEEGYYKQDLILANRLLVAAISGSAKAEKYFKDYDIKFQPDAGDAEEYEELVAMLKFAKQNQ